MVRAYLGGIALIGALAISPGAWAQQAQGSAPQKAEHEGYDGVVPGSTHIVPPGAPWRSKRHAPVFWIGFQQQGDSSRFFVQLGREVDFQQRLQGNSLFVHLPGARLANSNAARRLVTRYFGSSVAEVKARRVGKRRRLGRGGPRLPAGVELRFTFVNPLDAAQASASQNREADGFTYLYLDFGPASDQPESSESSELRDDAVEFE